MPKPTTEQNNPTLWATYLGILLVLCTALGLGIGVFLDGKFNTAPYLTILFFFLGTIAGFWQIIKEVKKNVFANKKKDN